MKLNWERLLSKARYRAENSTEENGRSPFQKDIDRIIFSNSFRRLNHKTQVHPLPQNDHVHTRLTHSLEVSCVGRSLGTKVGEKLSRELGADIKPSDVGTIVQAACLAHDIGNPPFGHSGEAAIRHWFKENLNKENALAHPDFIDSKNLRDFTHFEGNAQGLRVITQLEYYLDNGGLRLTYATLGTFLKYPWTSTSIDRKNGKKKHGCNQTELHILESIAKHTGLVRKGDSEWCRHPLSYLMEAADDICYALIDLEDGLEMGLLTFAEVQDIYEKVISFDELPPKFRELQPEDSERRKIAFPRGRVMDKLIDAVVKTFIRYQKELLSGDFPHGSLIEACERDAQSCVQDAKNIAKDRIFKDPRKIQLEIGAYSTIETLLNAFLQAAYNQSMSHRNGPKFLTFKDERILALMGTDKPEENWPIHKSYMRILDYIAGMTDNYATHIAHQLRGMGY